MIDDISRRAAIKIGIAGVVAVATTGCSSLIVASKGDKMKIDYDVLIIGGGPAGLSAAMALGRMLRSALVCDDGRPRNQASAHANNLVSQDGINPVQWRKQARADLQKYRTISFYEGSVKSVEKAGPYFKATLSSGGSHLFRKVILAYGVKDKLPTAPGFKELWGKAVFHCPYCHGYEFHGKQLGFVGNGKFAEHMLPMLFGLSKDVIIFTNGKSELSTDFQKLIEHKNIKLVESKIRSLVYHDEILDAVELEDGSLARRDGLLVGPILPTEMKATIAESLGCEKTEMGFYKVLEFGKTNIPSVFVAGDIMTMQHSVLGAASLGQMAGAIAASELLNEEFNS